MSEQQSAQEKTEQPTPKRLLDARRKGQVARSRELNTVAVMLAGAAGLLVAGDWMMARLMDLARAGFALPDARHLDGAETIAALYQAGAEALLLLSPLLLILLVSVFVGPALMGGLMFSGTAARPKLERLNPLAGLKRIFSLQGLMELLKTLLKFAVLATLACLLLWSMADDLLSLGHGQAERGMGAAGAMIRMSFLVLAAGLVVIAAVDAPFQYWNHLKQLRMTRQEVRDEMKETDGSPEVKGRIRRAQQEMAGRRMMADVPDADVVITNPTHYAVALKYSDRPDRAPRVVAKGRDLVAARIREIAAEHGVPVCSAPPLARAIYFNAGIGEEIPAALYLAVARVLAWVFQLRTARADGQAAPAFPADLPVPGDLAGDHGASGASA